MCMEMIRKPGGIETDKSLIKKKKKEKEKKTEKETDKKTTTYKLTGSLFKPKDSAFSQ